MAARFFSIKVQVSGSATISAPAWAAICTWAAIVAKFCVGSHPVVICTQEIFISYPFGQHHTRRRYHINRRGTGATQDAQHCLNGCAGGQHIEPTCRA